jgi:hypothetical protein
VNQVERILRRRRARALPTSILMTASVLAVAFMMASTVWGAPVPKAIGNVTFSCKITEAPVTMKFTAFQTTPEDGGDRGTFKFSYQDDLESERYFEFDVIHVNVHTQTEACFTGPVTYADYPDITPGLWVVVYVRDGGVPGYEDGFGYGIAENGQEEAIEWANYGSLPILIAKITSGNIQVSLPISEILDG